jgi:hypothetical protein
MTLTGGGESGLVLSRLALSRFDAKRGSLGIASGESTRISIGFAADLEYRRFRLLRGVPAPAGGAPPRSTR